MRTIQLSLPLVSFILFGCATSSKPSSEWDGLDSAEKVPCEVWPKPDKAIGVQRVTPLLGSKVGFVASYQLRNGGVGYYYLPFNDDENIDIKDAEARSFGAGSVVAGGGVLKGQLLVGVIQFGQTKPKLELRSVSDNVVRYSVDLPAKDMKAPVLSMKGSEVWLQYREAADDVAVEDAKVGFMRIAPGRGKDLTVMDYVAALPVGTEVISNDDADAYALAVWGEKTGASPKSFKFFVQTINNNPKLKSKPAELEIPIDAGVESWSVEEARKGFFLSFVDGDSLVGQANLRFGRVFWQDGYQKVSWVKVRSLLNQHVSDGSWVKLGGKHHLLMPKWVDQESTLGVYSLSDSDIDNVKAVGIFPTSVRLLNVFKGTKSKDVFALVRARTKGSVRFDLCNLGEL